MNSNQILFRGELNFHAMNWWLSKAPSINFDSLLVPNIPTLIIGGSEDCAVPKEKMCHLEFSLLKRNTNLKLLI